MVGNLAQQDIEKNISLFFTGIAKHCGSSHQRLQLNMNLITESLILRYEIIQHIITQVKRFSSIRYCHDGVFSEHDPVIKKLEIVFLLLSGMSQPGRLKVKASAIKIKNNNTKTPWIFSVGTQNQSFFSAVRVAVHE